MYPIIKMPANIEAKLQSNAISMKTIDLHPAHLPSLPVILPPSPRVSHYQKYFWYIYLAISAFALAGIFASMVPAIGVLGYAIGSLLGIARYLQVDRNLRRSIQEHESLVLQIDWSKIAIESEPEPIAPKKLKIDWQEEAAGITFSSKDPAATQGASEAFFLSHLKRYFGDRVSFGFAYTNPNFPHPYTSDFELRLENGLGIQIEIDEPYAFSTNEPHHSTSNKKDLNRDNFFLDRGWIIVRFAEEQICQNPRGCCGTIAQIVFELTQDDIWLELVDAARSLSTCPTWNDARASQMSKTKYRKTYLEKVGLS
jgi:hypothetical protein